MDLQDNNSIQNDINSGNQQQTPQPGSLNYIPLGGGSSLGIGAGIESVPTIASSEAAPLTEAMPQTEKTPLAPESKKPIETEPVVETQEKFVPIGALAATDKPEEPVATPAKKQDTKTNIVDKSNEPLNLHHLQHPHDKLTEKADKEEEQFINEVEAIHEHK